MVAVPMEMAVAVRTPATMVGSANGSSMWRMRCRAVNPSAVPAMLDVTLEVLITGQSTLSERFDLRLELEPTAPSPAGVAAPAFA